MCRMILSLGIDSVAIARFQDWHKKPVKQLQRIFSPEEITYCLSNPTKSAERFAARFAAKEAFYKALHSIIRDKKLPLFTVCKNLVIKKHLNGAPFLAVDWEYFKLHSHETTILDLATHLSITHTKTDATAIVILETKNKGI